MPPTPIKLIKMRPFNERWCMKFEESWYLCYYVPYPEHKKADIVTNALIDFKEGEDYAVDAWTSIVVQELKAKGIKFDIVVRALSSKELKASGDKPMDHLGKNLVANIGGVYLPAALTKTAVTTPMHKIKKAVDRASELDGKYKCGFKTTVPANSRILILDDISTSGTTLTKIREAIIAKVPTAKIHVLTLGRTRREPDINDHFDTAPFISSLL